MDAANAITAASACMLALRMLALRLQAGRVRRRGTEAGRGNALTQLGRTAACAAISCASDLILLWVIVKEVSDAGAGLAGSALAVAVGAVYETCREAAQDVVHGGAWELRRWLGVLAGTACIGAVTLAAATAAPGTWWLVAGAAWIAGDWALRRVGAARTVAGRPEGWLDLPPLPQAAYGPLAAAGLEPGAVVISPDGWREMAKGGVPALCDGRGRIIVTPELAAGPQDRPTGMIAHEAGHCAHGHGWKREALTALTLGRRVRGDGLGGLGARLGGGPRRDRPGHGDPAPGGMGGVVGSEARGRRGVEGAVAAARAAGGRLLRPHGDAGGGRGVP